MQQVSTATKVPDQAGPSATRHARALVAGYGASPDEMPLGGYAVLLGAYVTLVGSGLFLARHRLPLRIGVADGVLLGVATHKMARIAAKDWVTSPIRAPFVRYEGSADAGEVNEKSRGTGLRRAVGDLLTCPWCLAPWVGAGVFLGYAFQPRVTRTVARVFAAVAFSDVFNHVYNAVKKLSK